MKKRKVIQITATSTGDTENCFREDRVFALCDDGLVYMSLSSNGTRHSDWELLPEIPQDE